MKLKKQSPAYSCVVALGAVVSLGYAHPARAEGQWVTSQAAPQTGQVVLHFRRTVMLEKIPSTYLVKVSADNRFALYVNGQRVGAGPARGDLTHWRYEVFDLKPYLKKGANVVTAEIWNAAKPGKGLQTAPLAQITARTAFWLEGQGAAATLDTDKPWRVAVQPGHGFTSPFPSLSKKLKNVWYAASSAETIDGKVADWEWQGAAESKVGWDDAVSAVKADETSPWTLVPDRLPPMAYTDLAPGKVVRSDLANGNLFPKRAATIAANSEATLLIDQAAMISAYPELLVSGGKGAKITVTYAEALYDAASHKGDRDAVGDRQAIGLDDVFLPDGSADRLFRPLWWRTWRYMRITVKTGAEPLVLEDLKLHETGYPFETKGYFKSDDKVLDKIWEIGWRTLKVDAHDTFMDSSYWEQLQYIGDTRIEAMVAYAVSGDPRLPEQAIEAFAHSQRPDGMMQSAYPSSSDNIIAPFSLLWIGMLHDYWMQQPDKTVVTRNLPAARKVLNWYAPYVAPNGLLNKNPTWNFVDWVKDPPLARDAFPSFDKETGTSCLTSLIYLGALKQAADLEMALGDADLAIADQTKAKVLTTAIRAACWDERRGLFSDDPSRTVFSQHSNALTVLYDVAPAEQMKAILGRITKGNGIDPPEDILETSYYFSWYLVRAYEHAGLGDQYLDLLQTWRDLTKLNYTTWPESRGHTRSDSHAWSAHPTADLINLVAGIQSSAPGYADVEIAPHPGKLSRFEAAAATPSGLVSMRFKRSGRSARFKIGRPEGLPGQFRWCGETYKLVKRTTTFKVPSACKATSKP